MESEDLVLWGEKAAENFAEIGNPLTNENKAKFLKSMKTIFNALTLHGYAGKSKKRFVGFFVFSSRLPFFRSVFARHVKPIFEAVDVNGDGNLSWEEFYLLMLKPVGMSEEMRSWPSRLLIPMEMEASQLMSIQQREFHTLQTRK